MNTPRVLPPNSSSTTSISSTAPVSDNFKTQTHVNNLPCELLAPIFDSIQLPNRNHIRTVCKRWKDIMDEMVGMEIRIGSFSEFDTLTDGSSENALKQILPIYHDPSIISNVGIQHCIVGNINDNTDSLEQFSAFYGYFNRIRDFIFGPLKSELQKFKNPEIVDQITFFGSIPSVNFGLLIADAPNLSVLSLHLAVFNTLEESSLQLDFPILEVFIIRGKVAEIDHHLLTEWNAKKIIKNLSSVFKNCFPRLNSATIDYIYDLDQQPQINKSVMQFLNSHSSTIRKFTLEYPILINQGFEETDLQPAEDQILLNLSNKLQETVQLECLQIIPLSLVSLPYSNLWSPIVRDQKCLQIFRMVGVFYRLDFVQRIIDFNFKSLTKICIYRIVLFENLTPVQFDCSVFQPCRNLKYLALRGWTVTLSVRSLINIRHLPKTLITIDFGDMAIGTDDIRILALEMPNLEELELRFVGNRGHLGMDEETLKQIVARRRLKGCILQRAFNGKLTSEGIFNNDSEDPDYITESMGGFIGFRRTKRGFYSRTPVNLKMF